MSYATIIDVLEESVKKNGEQPLTNSWLLNIMRMAERWDARDKEMDYFRHLAVLEND